MTESPEFEYLDCARKAAIAGGEVVSHYFAEGVEMRSKESYNLVSDADINAEHAIVEVIHKHFPQHAVLGEEEHEADPFEDHVWIIDPLDGTNNFAHKVPHFAVSVGYYQKGEAVCGVVLNPIRDETYEAVRGQGAFVNGVHVNSGGPLQLHEVLVGVGFYYDRGHMMKATLAAVEELFGRQIHGVRRFGTASLDLCMVGSGLLGAFFEYQLSPWDYAAGQLFVREAGGVVSDCRGQELPLTKSSVLACNAGLHETMLDIVGRHHP